MGFKVTNSDGSESTMDDILHSHAQPTEDEIKARIIQFVKELEVMKTADICECEWREAVPNRPKVLSNVTPFCPIHTTEGLIYHYNFKWEPKNVSK